MGIDVIITDYPIKVSNQLKDYYSDKLTIEGCKSIEKNNKNIKSCKSCKNGYELVNIVEKNKNICKLKYELIPDLYKKNDFNIYYEKNIVSIKMLYSPIEKKGICQKNGKTIFYFDWLFDLYGYDYDYYSDYSLGLRAYLRKYIINKNISKNSATYSLLTEEHIKKLNFNGIEIYVDNNLIDQNDFVCIDLYSTTYFSVYTVMGAHCYFIYYGEQKTTYNVKFKLFNENYVSYVTYDGKFLINEDSWRQTETISFYDSSKTDSICNDIKDPFKDRLSCKDKISNCKYCENEISCKKCNDEFTLVNGQCFPLKDYQDNLKYFTPDYGLTYYTCSSVIDYCEECFYDYFSFNNFHCTKCSNGLELSDTYECHINQHIIPFTDTLSGRFIGSSCLNEENHINCHLHKIEISNFSCWKYKDTINNEERCIIYPDDESTQKEYYNFYLGISKEQLLINQDEILIPEKEYYKVDETITFKRINDIITSDDLLKFNKDRTCYSLFYKGYSSFLLNKAFANINNPLECYNALKFSEHNNIMDCGFAKISMYYDKKKYEFQTCYFMPNDKMSKIMLDFYRRTIIEEMWGKEGIWGKYIKDKNENNNENNNGEMIDKNNFLGERKLQENDDISFEMTIQNNNGKVIKFDSNSYNITVVKTSNIPFEDTDKATSEDNSDIVIFRPNNSNRPKFNWLLIFYIVLSFIIL